MSLASVGVLVACMIIIGLAILISENVSMAIGNLEQQNVVMAYMKDYTWALYGQNAAPPTPDTEQSQEDTDSDETENEEKADEFGIKDSDYIIHNQKEAEALCKEIEKIDNVAEVTLVTSEEGLASVTQSMLEGQEEYFDFLKEEHGNPMPTAAKIKMEDMSKFDETIEKIVKLKGVDNILSYSDLAEKITSIKNGLAVASVWIIAILMIISLVIVSNTIRVTMYSRKLEIGIMKAVGATDSFVRLPFVVEGVVIGLISADIALILLYFCYRVATEALISSFTTDIVPYSSMVWVLQLVFIAIGVLAGVIGSVIIISKYLKREGSEFAAI